MRVLTVLIVVGLCGCDSEPSPPDPQLLAAAELAVFPNSLTKVTDGQLVSGIYFVTDSGYGYPRMNGPELLYVDPSPIITVGNCKVIRAGESMEGDPEVQLHLDEVGRARFLVATRRSVNKELAIVVDNAIVSAPVVLSEIPGGNVSITMGSDPAVTADDYVRMLGEERKRVAPVR